jgi:hypothetical protein
MVANTGGRRKPGNPHGKRNRNAFSGVFKVAAGDGFSDLQTLVKGKKRHYSQSAGSFLTAAGL